MGSRFRVQGLGISGDITPQEWRIKWKGQMESYAAIG